MKPISTHGPQTDRQQQVIDRVDAGEVVHRLPVDLAVDGEVVVQDRVRADRVDADLVTHPLQRGQQLGPDLLPAGQLGAQQLGQPLAADHRLPRPVQRHTTGASRRPQLDDRRLRRWGQRGGMTTSPSGRTTVTSGTEATA